MTRVRHFFVTLLVVLSPATPLVRAQSQVVREVIEEGVEQIAKQAGEKGAAELAELGGKAAVRELLEQSSKEGGEELVEKVTQYGVEDGALAIRVIKRAPAKMVQSLDELAPELRVAAMQTVERDPAVMTDLVGKYGSGALEVATKHPGVGVRIVEVFGDDGIALGRKLSTDQSIVLARHASEISALPATERAGILTKIAQSPVKVLDYLEAHPKILKTTAGVGVVLAIKGDVLGDPGTSTIMPDGRIISTPAHPGFLERALGPTYAFLETPLILLTVIVAVGVAGWFATHLIGKWKYQKAMLTLAVSQHASASNTPPGERPAAKP